MTINKEKLKNMLEQESYFWLRPIIFYCGGFDAFVSNLEKTAKKKETKIIYGSSPEWRIVYKLQEDKYFLINLKNKL